MKRFLFLLTATVLIITLASCGSPPTLKTDFSAMFNTQIDSTDYAGAVNKNGDHMTITMKEPYTIAGMVFDYTDSGLSIRSNSHSTNADADYLSDNSVPGALRNALLYLSQASYNGSQNGVDSYSVTTPYGEATMTADDGYLTEITEPHSGLCFKFSASSKPTEE